MMGEGDKIDMSLIETINKNFIDPLADRFDKMFNKVFQKLDEIIQQNADYSGQVKASQEYLERYRIEHEERHAALDAMITGMGHTSDCNYEDTNRRLTDCQVGCLQRMEPQWRNDIKNAMIKDERDKMKFAWKMFFSFLTGSGVMLGIIKLIAWIIK